MLVLFMCDDDGIETYRIRGPKMPGYDPVGRLRAIVGISLVTDPASADMLLWLSSEVTLARVSMRELESTGLQGQ